jgi:hypothetical protein
MILDLDLVGPRGKSHGLLVGRLGMAAFGSFPVGGVFTLRNAEVEGSIPDDPLDLSYAEA